MLLGHDFDSSKVFVHLALLTPQLTIELEASMEFYASIIGHKQKGT
jgi:hypothetical protein